MLETKKQQDEVLDELFDYGTSKKKQEESEKKEVGGLQALRDSSEDSSSNKNSPGEEIEINDIEINPDQKEAHLQKMQYLRAMQE